MCFETHWMDFAAGAIVGIAIMGIAGIFFFRAVVREVKLPW
jgi:hypothetical protein